MDAFDAQQEKHFSLVVGGPFHALLRRVGLVQSDMLLSPGTALSIAAAIWAVPCIFATAQTLVDSSYTGGLDIFGDVTVYSRYFIAIAFMLITERVADSRVQLLVRQFYTSGLLPQHAIERFNAAIGSTDRLSGSALAEAVILVLAFSWSIVSLLLTSTVVSASGWEGNVADGSVSLSWAGRAALLFSYPLFLFLFLRWIWRFLVWAALLARISRLDLRLMPLHPDRVGGLGFLSLFPGIFGGLILALGCVVASTMYKAAHFVDLTDQAIWIAIAAWIGFVAFLFVGPLVFFARPLYRARERAVVDYGRLAHQHHAAFKTKWIDGSHTGKDLMGSSDPSSVSDLNASVEAALNMRTLPVDRAALLELLIAAGAPFLVLLASRMPLQQLIKAVLGSIL